MSSGPGVIAALVGVALVLCRRPLAKYIVENGVGAGTRGDKLRIKLYELVALLLGTAFLAVGVLILLGIARPTP